MYLRLFLALSLAALVVAGESRLLQAQQHACQTDFDPLKADLESKGQALQSAGKRKASPKELCARISAYGNAEAKMIKFFDQRAAECGVPPNVAEGLRKSRAKTTEMKAKICQAAANPAAAPAPPPSAGLSGALGPSTSGNAPETPGGGGIFDTLTGNVLQR